MATTSLGRLTLDLVAQIGQFVEPLNQAERKAGKLSQKRQYIRHCLLQSEQPQLDMPERRGTAYHRRTCHPV